MSHDSWLVTIGTLEPCRQGRRRERNITVEIQKNHEMHPEPEHDVDGTPVSWYGSTSMNTFPVSSRCFLPDGEARFRIEGPEWMSHGETKG